MAIIKTLDNFDAETELEVNQTNFPCLKLLFQVKEATGDTAINEVISGNDLACTITAGTNAYNKNLSTYEAFTIPQTTTSSALYFAIGNGFGATNAVAFGDFLGGTDAICLRSNVLLKDNPASFSPNAFTQTTGDTIRALFIKPGSPLLVHSIEYDGTTYSDKGEQSAVDIFSLTPDAYFVAAGGITGVYQAGILEFTNTPSTGFIKELILWMFHNTVTNGNKTIYPALRYVS